MNYKDLTTKELETLWQQKRTELAQHPPGECIKEMGELYKIRTELEKRHGSDKPIVNVDFTKYTTD